MRAALSSPRSPRAPQLGDLHSLVARRAAGEPLQYVLGTQPFGPLELHVRPPTLIPRSETEHWATTLAERLKPPADRRRRMHVLDLCTGTGCVPLLLLRSWPAGTAHATAVDVAQTAVDLARENAEVHDVPLVNDPTEADLHPDGNTFSVVQADVFSPEALLAHPSVQSRLPFDLITANPPYIPLDEYTALDASVTDWEDPRALLGDPAQLSELKFAGSRVRTAHDGAPASQFPGGDEAAHKGLTFYHAITDLAARPGVLHPSAPLVFEVGHNQADSVRGILENALVHGAGTHAFAKTEIWKDHAGHERVVAGWRAMPGSPEK